MINNFYKLFKDETSGLSQKINDDDIDDVGGHDKVSKDEKKVMEYGFDAIFTKEDWKGFSCLFLSLEYKI